MGTVRAVSATALLLTGTVGVGKTTTADQVAKLLTAAGIPHAVIDLDELCRCWPAPAEDPFHFQLQLGNLRAVSRAYRDAGAQRLVLAGVCETRQDRESYASAVGVPLQVCRLRGTADVVAGRLRTRHVDDADALAWHLNRRGELDAVLDAAAVADVEVVVDGLAPSAVAVRVLAVLGW
jgi:predicted kinase